MEGDSEDEPRAGEPASLLAMLQNAQLVGTLSERVDRMAADLKLVQQVVGVQPPTPSVAPQARTYQVKTWVVACVAAFAGALFDKLVLLAREVLGFVGN